MATRPGLPRNLCGPAQVDYRRASHRATISSVARGCSAVGSASPCQGEGRGFESRHPLEGATGINPQRWSGRVVRQRPAKPCTRVRFPSPPPACLIPGAISSAGERFPDTEEVTGSIPVSRTTVRADKARSRPGFHLLSAKHITVHALAPTARTSALTSPGFKRPLGCPGNRIALVPVGSRPVPDSPRDGPAFPSARRQRAAFDRDLLGSAVESDPGGVAAQPHVAQAEPPVA
jgi:hypothetical protein